MGFIHSAWNRVKFSEDCGANGLCNIAEGYHIPDTDFCEGDANQIKKMLKHLWEKSKKAGKVAVWGLFPMETFMDDAGNWNLWKENYKVNRINWKRVNKANQANKAVYEK